MNKYTEISLALDFSKIDEALVKAAIFIAKKLDINRIDFFHCIKFQYSWSQVLTEMHEDKVRAHSIDKEVANLIRSKYSILLPSTIKNNITVTHGDPQHSFVTYIQGRKKSLVLMGNKKWTEGSGLASQRIAQKIINDVLFVPDNTEFRLSNILIPVDFTNCSPKTLSTALSIKSQVKDCQIRVLHVLGKFPVDHYLGRSISYQDKTFHLEAENAYQGILDKCGFEANQMTFSMIENNLDNTAYEIIDFAKNNRTDLIIMGAGADSYPERLMHGSVTAKMLMHNKDIPMLIIR